MLYIPNVNRLNNEKFVFNKKTIYILEYLETSYA